MRYMRAYVSAYVSFGWCISESLSIRVSHVVEPAYIGTDYDCANRKDRVYAFMTVGVSMNKLNVIS